MTKGQSGWPVHEGPNEWDAENDKLRLRHSEEDQDMGFRAYFPIIMDALRCHQDVQQADGRGLLMKYVASYTAKFSDSFANEWLSDEASDYALARKILFDYHPLEPEMWLQLMAQTIPHSFTGGTLYPILAPYPGMDEKTADVKRYEDCRWLRHMSFLEFLRKTNEHGEPARYIVEAHNAAKTKESLHAFTRSYKTKGEKLIAVQTLWRMNDKYYGQWLVLHEPFRQLEDLEDAEVRSLVPEGSYHLACALKRRPDYWRDPAAVRADMELEAVATVHIETILNMIQGKSQLIDDYLSGRISKADEEGTKGPEATSDSAGARRDGVDDERSLTDSHQRILEEQINKRVDVALALDTVDDGDAAEEKWAAVELQATPLAVLGPPGTGKTYVISRCVRRTLQKGGKVLIALPTGQLASRMRQVFGDKVDVDTCHGAFLLHRPEQEALPLMSPYHLVFVDEFPQLSREHFDRIIRMWQAAGKAPALVFAGDFHQLPTIGGKGPQDSPYWRSPRAIYKPKLVTSQRSTDKALLEKLKVLRKAMPNKDMFHRILRGHKAWSGHHRPTTLDMDRLFQQHPETTVVTGTRPGAAEINELVVALRSERQRALGQVDGDFDANAANYDAKGQLLLDRKPLPSKITLYKGLRLHLTRNLDKQNDFVNGMAVTVEAYHASSQSIRVRTDTGKRLAVHRYTDPDPQHHKVNFYPIRYGYASTIYKMQGATLPHVTIWLERAGLRAAAYVAMSRVKKDDEYLFGGKLSRLHFVPNI